MEYLHHMILILDVPEISAVLLCFVGIATCVCYHRNRHAKYLRNELIKVILGDQFLKCRTFSESPIEDVNNRGESDSEKTH